MTRKVDPIFYFAMKYPIGKRKANVKNTGGNTNHNL